MSSVPYSRYLIYPVTWYSFLIVVGASLALFFSCREEKYARLPRDTVLDLALWLIPGGIIGARVYYVVFSFHQFQNDLFSVFRVWEGGLAIYGGVIGGVIGLVIATRLKKISGKAMLDVISFGLLIGQSIGRWGNFTNRECFGRETTVPWRMGLVYSYKTFYYHPAFLYESLWNVIGFLLLHFWVRKKRKFDGQLFLCYLAWYGLGRLFIEGLRTDSLYVGSSNLRVSQLLAGLTCLFAAGFMIYVMVFRHPEPEELWVNREQKKAPAAAPAAPETEAKELMSEERFDEELSDAFRILGGGSDTDAEELLEEAVEEAAAESTLSELTETAKKSGEVLAEAEEAAAGNGGPADEGTEEIRKTVSEVFESVEAEGGAPEQEPAGPENEAASETDVTEEPDGTANEPEEEDTEPSEET